MTRLLVVGGGITGLAAAWEGVRSGAEVLLVEAEPRLGGKLCTERVDGLVIEHGPDSFGKSQTAVRQLIDELGLADQVISPKPVAGERSFIRSRGRLRAIPPGMGMVLPTQLAPFVSTKILSPWDKLRAGVDLVLPRRLGAEDTSVGEFLRARLGNGIVRKFADPLVGGIYGTSVDDLSLDALLPSLRTQEQKHRSLLLASIHASRASAGAGVPFVSLRGGMGSLADAAAEQLVAAGADVRTGVTVLGLGRHPLGGRVALSDGSTYRVDAVVLAGGAASSAQLLRPNAPGAAATLAQVRLRSTASVNLAYPADAFTEQPRFHGWLETQPAPISGATVSSAKWVGRAPDDVVLLRASVPDRRAEVFDLPDRALVGVVDRHLRRVLGIQADPVHQSLTRWATTMPTYTVGHLDRVAAVQQGLASQPGWEVAGSALNGTSVADCIADGRAAATRALADVG